MKQILIVAGVLLFLVLQPTWGLAGEQHADATIAYNNGNPAWSPYPSTLELKKKDWFNVVLTGFPAGAKIETITFYFDPQKLQVAGWWDWAQGENFLSNRFIVEALTDTTVSITNDESPFNDVHYRYSVKVVAPGYPPWVLDPEIINKKKGN